MNALARVMETTTPDLCEAATRTSTLYDLIEAIGDEAGPGEEGLIVEAVLDLMGSGRIRWMSRHGNPKRI